MSLVRQAYDQGVSDRERGRLRASPFYDEHVQIRRKRIDITPMLNAFWLAGFDGEPYPEQPHAIQKQSAATISGGEPGEGGRTGEAEGVGAVHGFQTAAREEGPDRPSQEAS